MSSLAMRAIAIHQKGGPEVLKLQEDYPIPRPEHGRVLIQVKIFGVNHSEMFTRKGHSPGVKFPRILGIEAAGIVAKSSSKFQQGDIVVTAMGGMGRDFDGGYAEYTSVPETQVLRLDTKLPWEVIGALHEMMQTAWGSLYTALRLRPDDKLLTRGGTTSIGPAAASLAKKEGAFVVSTTRKADRIEYLKSHVVDEVLIDDGMIGDKARTKFSGFTKILELVGVSTMADSFRALEEHGILCVTGIAGGTWNLDNFNPMDTIPVARYLTVYNGGTENLMRTPLQDIARAWEEGKIKIPIRTFKWKISLKLIPLWRSKADPKLLFLSERSTEVDGGSCSFNLGPHVSIRYVLMLSRVRAQVYHDDKYWPRTLVARVFLNQDLQYHRLKIYPSYDEAPVAIKVSYKE